MQQDKNPYNITKKKGKHAKNFPSRARLFA